jgi:hypothetical protein
MLTAEARISTATPSRYLVQFCKHAAGMARTHAQWAGAHAAIQPLARGEVRLHAECSETQATVSFDPWGKCTMTADSNTLVVHVEATDPGSLQRMQQIVTRDLERFGQRDHLRVVWQPPDQPSAHAVHADGAIDPPLRNGAGGRATRRQGRHQTLLLTVGGALGIGLIVAAHLALAGAVIAVPAWLGWAAAGVVAVPALMAVLHTVAPLTALGLGRHAIDRGIARHRGEQPGAGTETVEKNPTR